MKTLNNQEIQEKFGLSSEELDQLESDVTKGRFHGKPRGSVIVGRIGRPKMFGETTKQIGFREPVSTIQAIEKRASSLGMKRSDYLRYLVDQDLATMEA